MYNKGGDEIRIQTNWGDLVAQVGYDLQYPEIYIFLEMKDGVEFTLGCIGQAGDQLINRIKEELGCEDFTKRIKFSDKEIKNAYEEAMNE